MCILIILGSVDWNITYPLLEGTALLKGRMHSSRKNIGTAGNNYSGNRKTLLIIEWVIEDTK